MTKTALASPGNDGRDDESKLMDELGISDKPNYYAILPANIRYSPKLTWLEKILYAEISALSNKDGYCFATNQYFSNNFNVSDRTVRRAVTNLTDLGFLFTLYESVGGQTYRKIYLREKALEEVPLAIIEQSKRPEMRTPVSKGNGGVGQKCPTNSIIGDRSIVYSTIGDSINTNTTPPSTGPALICPTWLGKNSHARLAKIYELLWLRSMGVETRLKITGVTGAIFKRLLSEYSEPMVGLMLVAHFDWRGMSGTDDRAHKTLADAGFPLTWLSTRAETYKTFIIGQMKLDTDEKQLAQLTSVLEEITKK